MAESIGINLLAYYLQRVTNFIESSKKTLLFPNISIELEDVLVKFVRERNTRFLQSDQFNDEVKEEAVKLATAMDSQMTLKLAHEFIDGDYGPNVLMFKKIEVDVIKAPEPLRRPNFINELEETDSSFREILNQEKLNQARDSLVTPVFRTRCLNATTKFVKDDTQLMMKYPSMAASQAEFLMTMLLQGKEGKTEQTDLGFGHRTMYAPLWESMRVFSLKYEYDIKCENNHFVPDLKCVVFEKIPKRKVTEKMDVEAAVDPGNSTSTTTTTSTTPSTDSRTSSPKKQKSEAARPPYEFLVKIKGGKLQGLLAKIIHGLANEELTEQFVENCLRRIANFLSTESEETIEFKQTSVSEEHFINNVKRLCKHDSALMLFNSSSQIDLGNVRYFLGKGNMYTVNAVGKTGRDLKRDIIIKKTRVIGKMGEEKKEAVTSSLPPERTNTPAEPEGTLARYKQIKDSVEETYVHNVLAEISQFLSNPKKSVTFEQTNLNQKDFIKHVQAWSETSEVYDMFSSSDQILLDNIKLKAKKYCVKVVAREVPGTCGDEIMSDVTVVKKLTVSRSPVVKPNPKMKGRARSLSAGRRVKWTAQAPSDVKSGLAASSQCPQTRKEKLIEGLKLPVQSEKAVKMMQSMGWKGGALGLHGTGITEPIMPAIDLAKGAGLGHVKPPPKSTSEKTKSTSLNALSKEFCKKGVMPLAAAPPSLTPAAIIPPGTQPLCGDFNVELDPRYYRHIILQAILRLVTTNLRSVRFDYYCPKIKPKKFTGFIREAVRIFDQRLSWTFADATLTRLLSLIQAALATHRHLHLQLECDAAAALVYKGPMVPNNFIVVNNTAAAAQQNNTNVPQVTNNVDLTSNVVHVGKNSGVTGNIPNFYTKKNSYCVPNASRYKINLTYEELQNKIINDNVQVENTVKNDVNEISAVNDTDEEATKADIVKNGSITLKMTANDIKIESNVDNSEYNDAKNNVAVQDDNIMVDTAQNHVNFDNKNVKNDHVQNCDTDEKDVHKQSSINNHNKDKNNAKIDDNGIEALEMAQTDVKKESGIRSENNYENDELTVTYITLVESNVIIPEHTKFETKRTSETTSDKIEHNNVIDKSGDVTDGKNDDKNQTDVKTDNTHDKKENDEHTTENTIKIENVWSGPANEITDKKNSVTPEKSLELEISKANDISKNVTVKIENDILHVIEITDKVEGATERKLVKRPSLDSTNGKQVVKKTKLLADFKRLCILDKEYPQKEINREKAREIQTSILNTIDYKTQPLLKCEGIQNGGLIYSCQDEKSLFFMEDLVKAMHDLKIVYEFDVKEKSSHKMAFKMNSFIEEDVVKVLKRLTLFNPGLIATNWEVIKKEQYADFVVIYVELDNKSFQYICDVNFSLYAGTDCAKFSVVWD